MRLFMLCAPGTTLEPFRSAGHEAAGPEEVVRNEVLSLWM